jgi:nucleotide-binding universal stress UspA family protein
MAYKTILVHVDETRATAERIKLAAHLALASGAHLTGVAFTGVSRFLFQPGAMEMDDPSLSAQLSMLRERGQRALSQFDRLVLGADVETHETRVVDDEAGAGMVLQARYSDLVILGQYDSEERTPSVMPDFPEFVIINSGRPVLVVPHAGRFSVAGNRVLVAWDASVEATRAVTAALPILRRSALVRVVVINAEGGGDAHGEEPGADIALFLARHGVNVEVLQRKAHGDVGEALLASATELDADLMVMGGYGHSRFREVLLGGATRSVLEKMTLPVLMMH